MSKVAVHYTEYETAVHKQIIPRFVHVHVDFVTAANLYVLPGQCRDWLSGAGGPLGCGLVRNWRKLLCEVTVVVG